MKRRNADLSKLRRPGRRNKLAENFSSTLEYCKFIFIWAIIMGLDLASGFRFEYLWPVWLLFNSVYDSFKYQGLGFSIFFVGIALTSDVICYLFIPVQWIFFAASAYVWVQFVWHTDKGICLPTLSIWLLFIWIEANMRLKEIGRNLPVYVDLCRPFAAHCIGYPVVTLGFGFKGYISYKLRLRKQKEVEKENHFYFNLLQQALPVIEEAEEPPVPPLANGHVNNKIVNHKRNNWDVLADHLELLEFPRSSSSCQGSGSNSGAGSVNEFCEEADSSKQNNCIKKSWRASASAANSNSSTTQQPQHPPPPQQQSSPSQQPTTAKESSTARSDRQKKLNDVARLEGESRKLRQDLQLQRTLEAELRADLKTQSINANQIRSELAQLREDNDSLQQRLHNLVRARQQDKQNVSGLEKQLAEERKRSSDLSSQLASARKQAEQLQHESVVARSSECMSERCRSLRRELDLEVSGVKAQLRAKESEFGSLQLELASSRRDQQSQQDTDVLMAALNAMREKNEHLERNLSDETRIKLDLLSALGATRRQVEEFQLQIRERDERAQQLELMLLHHQRASSLNPHASDYQPH